MNTPPEHLSKALLDDLRRRLGVADLVTWLEQEAERLSNLGRSRIGAVAFSHALLRDRGVIGLEQRSGLPGLQIIVPTSKGYSIRYSPYQKLADQRFGIAHEIAHTFWFQPGGRGLPLSPLQNVFGDDPTIEWLCNRMAAAILLPSTDVATLLAAEPFILHRIPILARMYLAPERMVARRIFHDLAGEDLSLLAARGPTRRGESGRIVWFASAPTEPRAKRHHNRVIPHDLFPDVGADATAEILVDDRWWLLNDAATRAQRAKPLSQVCRAGKSLAWVGRCADTWYLALPTK